MHLDERKKKILQIIIDSYIESAEPIGSRTISKGKGFELSSATIRNEMADLEEMGYLKQVHASSGRIPSDLGYRFYVDKLMQKYNFAKEEIDYIKENLNEGSIRLEDIIRNFSKVLSNSIHYTTVAIEPQFFEEAHIKNLHLISVDIHNILVIVLTNSGTVKNRVIKIKRIISLNTLSNISMILNNTLEGLTLKQINSKRLEEIEMLLGEEGYILIPITECIFEALGGIKDARIFLEGKANIFNFPEYNKIQKIKEILIFMEEKQKLYELLTDISPKDKINTFIGSENKFAELKDSSIIISSYYISLPEEIKYGAEDKEPNIPEKRMIGTIAVIGPTRMDYSRTITHIEYLTDRLNSILKLLLEDGGKDE